MFRPLALFPFLLTGKLAPLMVVDKWRESGFQKGATLPEAGNDSAFGGVRFISMLPPVAVTVFFLVTFMSALVQLEALESIAHVKRGGGGGNLVSRQELISCAVERERHLGGDCPNGNPRRRRHESYTRGKPLKAASVHLYSIGFRRRKDLRAASSLLARVCFCFELANSTRVVNVNQQRTSARIMENT